MLLELAAGVDGLEYTRKWLQRNYHSIDVTSESSQQRVVTKVLNAAYIELLVWDETKQELYPETLLMDKKRFEQLRVKATLYTLGMQSTARVALPRFL